MRVRELRRGVTLIELMVSVAIMSVILTAVTSVVVSISKQRRESSAQVDVRTNGRIALSMIKFDGTNAGFRFGTAPFAVRVLQNVTGAEPELADTIGCGGTVGAGWTVLPGTDVIEFREGLDGLSVGKVPVGVTGCSGSCSINVNGGAYSNPFANSSDGMNSVLFFSNGVTGCAGRLTSTIAGGAITMLRQDLRTNAIAANYATSGAGACPAGDMSVTALGRATRYMICQPPAGNPTLRPGLFRQVFDGTMTAVAGQFTRIQDGVEDMQVATIINNNGAGVSGLTCSGTGVTATCTCGLLNAGDCGGFVYDPTASGSMLNGAGTLPQRAPFLARAYRVALTTISLRARGEADQLALLRPASFDHLVGTVRSGDNRAVLETTIIPQNIVMVQP